MNLVEIDRHEVTVGTELTMWLLPKGYCGTGGTVTDVTTDGVILRCGTARIVETILWDEVHHVTIEQALDADECLEYSPECDGPVDWHTTGSSLKAWPRCSAHAVLRQNRYENSSERFADSGCPPSDFDESAIGERWDED